MMIIMRNKRIFAPLYDTRIIHYAIAGGTAFIFDYATLLILTEGFGIYYLWSATAGFIIGSLVVYLLSIRWVFEERRYDDRAKEFSVFFIIGAGGLVLNDLLLSLLVEGLAIPYQMAKPVVAGLVMLYNYFARLLLVFTARQ